MNRCFESSGKWVHVLVFTGLFVIFQTPTLLHVGNHFFQKKAIQKEVKKILLQNICKDELVSFRFSLQESKQKLRWKHDGEFQYRGEMYDIVYKEYSNDSVQYWCWWDQAETALYKKMKKIVLHSTDYIPWKKQTEKRWLDFQKQLYCSDQIILSSGYEHGEGSAFFVKAAGYISIPGPTFSPPPEYLPMASIFSISEYNSVG